jgi:hypothetical protein|nr:hypothetical protein [Candidatus Krumholzibacteria bacterium]
MSRRFLIPGLVILTVLSFIFLGDISTQTPQRQPQPTDTSSGIRASALTGLQHRDLAGERREFKQQRREYFESMHKAAPGTDWKAMDEATRARLTAERAQERRVLRNRGQDPDMQPLILTGKREARGIWTEKGSNNLAGRMHTTTVHEGSIYAGSSGGIVWRGSVAGENWTPLNDWLRMPSIATVEILPQGGSHRIVVFHNGPSLVHYSDDEGLDWIPATGLNGPDSWGSPIRAELLGDAAQTLFLAAQEWNYADWNEAVGFYRSADRGASFQQLQLFDVGKALVDIWCPPGEDSPGYLIQDKTLFSFDQAGILTPVGTLPAAHASSAVTRTHLRGRTTADGADLYIAFSMNDGTSLIYSALSGGSAMAYRGVAPEGTFMNNSFEVSQEKDGELYIGGVDAYRSINGGQSWIRVNHWYEYYDNMVGRLHADIPGIHIYHDGTSEKVLVSTDGGIFSSGNGLVSVQNISLAGMRISQYYDVYTHQTQPEVVFAGAQDQGFQRSLGDDGGIMDFQQTISGDYAHLVSGNGGSSIWCVYPGFAMYYPNAVNSTSAQFWDFTVSGQYWLPPLMADPSNPARCWLGGGSSGSGDHLVALNSVSGNITATEQSHDFGDRISALAFSPLQTAHRYVMTGNGNFHYSTNGGGSWTQSPAFSGPEGHYFHGATIVPSPEDPETVWIGGSGYSNPPVYVSADHGQSFSALADGLPSTLVYMMDVSDNGQWLFAATEVGPYVLNLDETTWQPIAGTGAPDQVYWSVEWVEALQVARFATYGRGIWDFAVDTGSPASEDLPLVSHFDLRAAPNPFNPISKISFEIGQAGPVQLDLYNVRGAKVAEVFRGHLEPGRHEKNLEGYRLASGIYLLRLHAGGRHEDLRVTLVK